MGKGAVVITGASKGIGEACAIRLDRKGFHVFAGVRRESDGHRLQQLASPRLVPIRLDVTDPQTIAAAAERVSAMVGDVGIAGLVNNAGVAIAGPLECLPIEDLRRQLEINVVGQIAVTQAFLPLLRQGRGRIINMGSISGRSALPLTGAYAASKHALEALTDALRVELIPWGIDVIIIEPGVVATPIWETSIAAAEESLEKGSARLRELYGAVIERVRSRVAGNGTNGIPADRVAQVVEDALTGSRPKTRYLVGRDAKLRILLQRLPDRWRDRLIARRLGTRHPED